MTMQNEKKDSGTGYIVLIIIILVLGYLLYHSYDDAKLDDAKVLDYVQHNISFYEVCNCYNESKIKEYISDKYIPTDIWSDIDVLQDYSWWDLIDYSKKDANGQTLIEYLYSLNYTEEDEQTQQATRKSPHQEENGELWKRAWQQG